MRKTGYVFVLMFVLMSSFVLADISISEPKKVYNLGDKININAGGLRGAEIGNFNINLVCGNKTVNLIRWPARDFSTDEDQDYSVSKILVSEDLEVANLTEILGKCQIILLLGEQIASTDIFTISNKVFVSASTNKKDYNPGEGILVNISAKKIDGHLLNGFAEVRGVTNFSEVVKDGFASGTFSTPNTTEAGIYFLSIYVYDVGQDGVLNKGFANISFSINQVVSSVVMSLSNDKVVPGKNLTVGVGVFDQSGKEIEGTVSAKIISPENKKTEVLIPTGDFNTFNFPINATAGVWKVVTMFEGVGREREFEVARASKMVFNINDSVLEIRCVGNWECNGSVDVLIGEENMKLELKMGVGDIRKFSLKAPQGKYKVIISNGKDSISQNVLLTGNAISVRDFKEGNVFKMYSAIWILLIVLLGVAGVILFKGSRNTRTLKNGKASKMGGNAGSVASKDISNVPPKIKSYIPSNLNSVSPPKTQESDAGNYRREDKTRVNLTRNDVGGAESTLVLKGEKYLSAIVALSVKNYATLGDNAKDALVKVIEETKELKGLVDWREDYVFIVFSPLITKTYKNEILASKTGFRILQSLNDYNKKFRDKIEFNLGVHTGELIASKVGDKLKYTSLGNTISLAKGIADSGVGKLLVSEDIRKKMFRDLKLIKAKEVGKNHTYEVLKIMDREANSAKLKDLLKRMGGG